MKRYSLVVACHIVLLAAFSIAGYELLRNGLWLTTGVSALAIVYTGVHLYKLQLKQIGMMRRLTDSIRFNDMTQAFRTPFRNKLMQETALEFSETLKAFRMRLMEEEIKHQYYENLLDKVDTAVLVADKAGRIEWMNRTARKLLGPGPGLPAELLDVSGSPTRMVRLRQGDRTLETAVASTLFTTHGKEQLLISLNNIHSVLERNEMEAWQKLIRVLTHEIMNSITPIVSLAETLSDRDMPAKVGEKEYGVMLQAMQTIHRRSKGLLGFVENYRRLTRIPAPVYADISVEELFSDLKKLFPDEFIRFRPTAPGERLRADRTQLEQVMINLLKNAREACQRKADRSVEVLFSRMPDSGCRLTVSDNGEGIVPEVMDKIFIPFFTTKPSGSGIGLSLCKQIMNLHGGTIAVDSENEKGCRFTLTFPPQPDRSVPE